MSGDEADEHMSANAHEGAEYPADAPAEGNALRKDLEQERERSAEYLSRLHYLQADFDNYRKMVEKTNNQAKKLANEKLIVGLLPVLDSFEQALRDAPAVAESAQAKYFEGLRALYNEFMKVLECHDLRSVPSVGSLFDPHKHEVVQEVPDTDSEDTTIIEEFRKGYMLNGVVIRPAMVKIARNYSHPADTGAHCANEKKDNSER